MHRRTPVRFTKCVERHVASSKEEALSVTSFAAILGWSNYAVKRRTHATMTAAHVRFSRIPVRIIEV